MNILSTFLILTSTLSMLNVVSATDNWVTVNSWTGKAFPEPANIYTGNFVITGSEWRIIWSYEAVGGTTFESIFVAQTYEAGNDNKSTDLIYKDSYFSQHGESDIQKSGTFYINATIANIESYLIIVQQNIDSTPTPTPTQSPTSTPIQLPTATPFSSQNPTPTPTAPEFQSWIILLIFICASLMSIVFIKRRIATK